MNEFTVKGKMNDFRPTDVLLHSTKERMTVALHVNLPK